MCSAAKVKYLCKIKIYCRLQLRKTGNHLKQVIMMHQNLTSPGSHDLREPGAAGKQRVAIVNNYWLVVCWDRKNDKNLARLLGFFAENHNALGDCCWRKMTEVAFSGKAMHLLQDYVGLKEFPATAMKPKQTLEGEQDVRMTSSK